MKAFEQQLLSIVKSIRSDVAHLTSRTEILFRIDCQGRVNDGDFKIVFKLENQYDSLCNVEGGNLEAVVDEYVHRNSWQKANAPLCLPNVAPATSEEVLT